MGVKSAAIWWFGSDQGLFPELPQVSQRHQFTFLFSLYRGHIYLEKHGHFHCWREPMRIPPLSCVLASLQPRSPR